MPSTQAKNAAVRFGIGCAAAEVVERDIGCLDQMILNKLRPFGSVGLWLKVGTQTA